MTSEELLDLLHDVRDLVQELGLGEYGHMDPKATNMVERLGKAVDALTEQAKDDDPATDDKFKGEF